jgi:hypothetical protein
MAVWHRRAGKDEIVLDAMRQNALTNPGTYWHCFPEQAQARKAIWNGVNGHTGIRRILEAFPESIIKRMHDADMFIELKNGATFQLIGSDRYDSTVGSGPKGIAYSEWALSNPAAWAYHSPMIRESKGFAAFITTPRGNNHAKRMFDRAKSSPLWFSELLSINDTKTLSQDVLDEALEEYQDLHGIDLGLALFEQEYMCSFSGALVGAYFGAEMNKAERNGQFADVEIDEANPVHCVMDLGKAVNNPVWLFQVIEGELRIVDFYQPPTDDLDDWCADLRERGFNGNTYVPHDIMVTEWGSNKTRIERLRERKMNPKRIARVSVADGLQAGRMAINAAIFDQRKCEIGIEGLKNYRREWDAEMKTFRENPVKDWSEHIGSAWRYLGLCWRDVPKAGALVAKPKELEYVVGQGGIIQGNMSVKDAVEAMVKRRKARNE